jgi:hypothetical protein
MWRKKKMFKKITSICAVAVLSFAASVTAFADESDYYTKEYIIDEYWTQYWEDSLPGDENPEGSLEYHILEEWLDDVYGKSYHDCDIDWSSSYSIGEAWKDYYQEKTQYWHMNDDEETGEFTIEEYDPEAQRAGDVLYTFKLQDGKWNMIDSNGNVVDSFDPHGGDGSWYAIQNEDKSSDIDDFIKHMSDDSDESGSDSSSYITDTYDGETAQTTQGETAVAPSITMKDITAEEPEEETVADSSEVSESTDSSDGSSPLPYIAGGIVLIGAGGAAGYFVNKMRGRK